jgi:hypothetical protein
MKLINTNLFLIIFNLISNPLNRRSDPSVEIRISQNDVVRESISQIMANVGYNFRIENIYEALPFSCIKR